MFSVHGSRKLKEMNWVGGIPGNYRWMSSHLRTVSQGQKVTNLITLRRWNILSVMLIYHPGQNNSIGNWMLDFLTIRIVHVQLESSPGNTLIFYQFLHKAISWHQICDSCLLLSWSPESLFYKLSTWDCIYRVNLFSHAWLIPPGL